MALTWADLYDQAVAAFAGQTPTRDLENALMQAYEQRPDAVTAILEKAADRYGAGKAHSPWGLVKSELEHDARRANLRPVEHDADRETQTRLAETYIRNAGLYLPTELELTDDLMGDHGRLRAWAKDGTLTGRMTALWQAQQPRREQAERDATSRAERWKAARALAEQAHSPAELAQASALAGEPEPFPTADQQRDWSDDR